MDTLSDTDLGVTAEEFYEDMQSDRTGPVEIARRLADITLPSVFPPENWKSGDELAITNQSVNAYAVNTLASKMMLSGFPPGLPMAKFNPEEQKLEEDVKQDPELYSEILYALSRREETHRNRLQATKCRSAYVAHNKLLLVTGGALTLWIDIDNPIVYNLHNYVVKRDAAGTPIVTVLKEGVSRMVADEDVVQAADTHRADKQEETSGSLWDDEITIYHVQKLIVSDTGKKEWVYWQEVEGGHVVEGTVAYSPYDVPAMYADWLIPAYGSNWGPSYCQDYEGDLQAVEGFAAALQDGAAAEARYLTLVNPDGQTDLRDVQEADNLEVIPGREQDVTTMRSSKGGDLNTTSQEFQSAIRRIGQAFLMSSAIQRTGERVTAEEWRQMSSELDQAMGGLYSNVAQTTQRYYVLRFIHLHELSDKSLKKLPEGLVNISVVTGLDSLGQSSEGTRLREFAKEGSEVLTPAVFAKFINASDYLRRLAATKSIKSEGLVKDNQTMQQETAGELQQQQQNTLLEKTAGPLAKEGAGMLAQMMQQQGTE